MITYHEGFLGVNPDLLLRVRGSAIPKALIWAIPGTASAVALFFYWGGVDNEASNSVSQAWAGYSFVLGFLIVYRMQMAYNRYWEAASITNIMRGEWLDAYMSLCSFCSTDETKYEDVMAFKGLAMRLFSMLHQSAMSKLCAMDLSALPIIDPTGIESDYLLFCKDHPRRLEIIIVWLEQIVLQAANKGVVHVAPPILQRIFHEISQGMVGYQNAMKLRTYATPFPIVQVIQYLIIFHAMVTPIIASLIMYNWRWAAMLSFSSVCSFNCINYIAMEIESPFDDHYNALPIQDMQTDFNKSLLLSTNKCMWRPPMFYPQEARRFSKGAETLSVRKSMMRIKGNSEDEDDNTKPTEAVSTL